MGIITSVLFFGFCVNLVWTQLESVTLEQLKAVSNQTACRPQKVDLTIAIDNSNVTKKETFEKAKQKVKEILGNIFTGYTKFKHSVAVHTFGTIVYEDEEIKFSRKGSKIIRGVDKMTYRGTEYPRIDVSLRHSNKMMNKPKKRGNTHIYLYIGNGFSYQFGNFHHTMIDMKKEHPYLHVVTLYTDKNVLDYQQRDVLEWMSYNKHSKTNNLRTIDDHVFDIVRDIYLGVHCKSKTPPPQLEANSKAKCRQGKVDLTIAIDNSKSTSKETFEKAKDKVQRVLDDLTLWYKFSRKKFKHPVSIHTFGTEIHDKGGLRFTRKVTKILGALGKMSYHGDQDARIDESLQHTENAWKRRNKKNTKHLYIYIGNGFTQYFFRLWDKLHEMRKAYPNVYFLVIYTDKHLDSRQKTLLEWISANKFRVKTIDDDVFDISAAIDHGIDCMTEQNNK